MIIDCNAFIGQYPFRSLRFGAPGDFVARMDHFGISKSLVTSIHAFFYRNVQEANRELFSAVAKFPDRILPIGMVNIGYVRWREDLALCIDQGVKGIALAPHFHRWGSETPDHAESLHELLGRLAERELPVVLTQRLEDRRQRHAWDQASDLSLGVVKGMLAEHTKLKIMFCNWAGLRATQLLDLGLKDRCLIDLARMQVLQSGDSIELMKNLGEGSVCFGSHAAFDYYGPSLVKLDNLKLLFPDFYEKVAWKNATEFFGLR